MVGMRNEQCAGTPGAIAGFLRPRPPIGRIGATVDQPGSGDVQILAVDGGNETGKAGFRYAFPGSKNPTVGMARTTVFSPVWM